MRASSIESVPDSDADVTLPGRSPSSLTSLMRVRTRTLHARAERSGIINDVLRGRASRYGFALLLRNLLPAYTTLEARLEAYRHAPAVRSAARRELYRVPALRSDLCALFGPTWETRLPLLPSGRRYAERVATAAEVECNRLVAHAYARYFGDLSGGQVLKRRLAHAPDFRPEQLSFFDFPDISDIDAFKTSYRQSIDDSAATIVDTEAVATEAAVAFLLNIAISEAVKIAARAVL
jgi:heme oxygenase (biliverdin-producing, ferredoxin)